MFANSAKLFLLLTFVLASSTTIPFDATSAAESSATSEEIAIELLAKNLVDKERELAAATKALADAKTAVKSLETRIQTAKEQLEAAESDVLTKIAQLHSAERALAGNPNDAKLKGEVTKAEGAAAAAALAARKVLFVFNEMERELSVSQWAGKNAADKVAKTKGEIKEAMAKLVQSKKAVDSIAAAAKSAQAAAKSAAEAVAAIKAVGGQVTAAANTATNAANTAASAVRGAAAPGEGRPEKEARIAPKPADDASLTPAGKIAKDAIDRVAKFFGALTKRTFGAWNNKADSAHSPSDTSSSESAEPIPSPDSDKVAETRSNPIDVFVRLPLVTPIEKAREIADFCPSAKQGEAHCDSSKQPEHGKSRCECAKEYVCDYRFDAPAHFPLPGFSLRGEKTEGEGAIIYEGMRVTINKDGRYQVRFIVGTPAMPVTMRLQLILEDEGTRNRYTLTLPPVSIPELDKPEHTSQQREVNPVYANIQTVHFEGYLPALDGRTEYIRIVRRTGSARFGFGVDVP